MAPGTRLHQPAGVWPGDGADRQATMQAGCLEAQFSPVSTGMAHVALKGCRTPALLGAEGDQHVRVCSKAPLDSASRPCPCTWMVAFQSSLLEGLPTLRTNSNQRLSGI